MTLRALTAWAAITLLATASDTGRAQEPPSAFRSSIDVATLDVTVLDEHRRPVRGLTAADFHVTADGNPRPIVGFNAIDLPDRVRGGAQWLQEVTPDVSTNGFTPDRIVILLLDDWNTAPEAWAAQAVRRIGHAILDELGPADLAGIVFPFQTGKGVDFTTDRARLRTGVDRFVVNRPDRGSDEGGACRANSCVLGAMRAIADATRAWPDRRKLLVFVGPQGNYLYGPQNVEENASQANMNAVDSTPALMDTFRELQRANVTVYQFDPRNLVDLLPGYQASMQADPGPAPLNPPGMFADSTGGWTVTRTDEPWQRAAQMFVENDSYYMLGIAQSTRAARSGFHPVRVTVDRPGVTVQARSGYYDPNRRAVRTEAQTALDRAMLGPVPASGLPLSLTVAPFRIAGTRSAALAVIGGLDQADSAMGAGVVDVAVRAFDESKAGRNSKGLWRSTLRLQPHPSESGVVHYDTLSRLDLPPGRYEVRVSMQRASDDVAGGVTTFVTVPDFDTDPLSLSGVVLGRLPAGSLPQGHLLSSVLPFAPTTRRTFASAETLAVLLRVYQGGKSPLRPATLTTRIVSDRDVTVLDVSATLDPAAFTGAARAAEYQFRLPLARLAAGEYLLTVDAALDERTTVARQVRLRVK